ncbi:hypothetical protein O181_032923 [Austropuccinia psidii MF-1]|uniref:Uncharacterized protein n=1 Tax=Austropuccinia psidii MF-1 TaxID=1389203 RepID=A0A9Q3H5Y8_9BASI|nr:hypothetical protein [Austropuccinia psidii MF-1]
MGFKRQKQNPMNPSQQDSPIPCMPHKQTPQPPTPGLSGTQWLEDLSGTRHATPRSVIIIDNMPIGSPPSPHVTPPSTPTLVPSPVPPRAPPPPFLIPTMMLATNLLT